MRSPTRSGTSSRSVRVPPISTIVPQVSWPGMYGTPPTDAETPSQMCTSVPQSVAASTLMRTPPGSSAGIGTDWISSGACTVVTTAARLTSGIGRLLKARREHCAHCSIMTIAEVVRKLAAGETSATQLVGAAFARINDPNGEGARTFVRTFEPEARAAAAGWDVMRAAGVPVPILAGIPISVKDLFDVAGTITTAGSRALADAPRGRARRAGRGALARAPAPRSSARRT